MDRLSGFLVRQGGDTLFLLAFDKQLTIGQTLCQILCSSKKITADIGVPGWVFIRGQIYSSMGSITHQLDGIIKFENSIPYRFSLPIFYNCYYICPELLTPSFPDSFCSCEHAIAAFIRRSIFLEHSRKISSAHVQPNMALS